MFRALGAMCALAIVLSACSDAATDTSPTSTTSGVTTTDVPPSTEAPDAPPSGDGAVIDWSDPSKVADFGDGWSIGKCTGDAPLLCAEHNGQQVGLVEAAVWPIDSLPALDPDADADANLAAHAAAFYETFVADRAEGCGEDYVVDTHEVETMVLGGVPGVSFGFTGTWADGTASELILQYAVIDGDRVLSMTANGHAEGGCLGPDEFSWDPAALAEFRAHLEEVLIASPLPDLPTPVINEG